MIKPLHRKLKSSRGASLSVALLLFMVCAVLGGVILTSATTASGRLADLAESDARYYSITSAADLIVDAIDGKSVTMVRECKNQKTVTDFYQLNDEEEMVPDHSSESSSPTVYNRDNALTPYYVELYQNDDSNHGNSNKTNTYLMDVASRLFFRNVSSAASSWTIEPSASGPELSKTRTMTLSQSNDLTVYLTEKIKANGDLVIVVSSSPTTSADSFNMELNFSLGVTTTPNTTTTRNTVVQDKVVEGGVTKSFKEVETITTTETKTSVMTWTLTEIKKVGM